MTKEQLQKVSLNCYQIMFYKKKRFPTFNKNNNQIRYLDYKGFRFIEQNKNKNSKYGSMARNGSNILWVIRLKDNKYVAKVVNGNYQFLLEPKN